MSASVSNPYGRPYDHHLQVVKGNDPVYLNTTRGRLHSAVDTSTVLVYPGRVVHVFNTTVVSQPITNMGPPLPNFKMGCVGAKHPAYLRSGLYDYYSSNKGTPSGVAASGSTSYPPNWFSTNPSSDLTKAVLSAIQWNPNLELETTEYDTDQTYSTGEFLRAVTSDSLATAGALTNQDASGGAGFATSSALTVGTDTIVGQVNKGEFRNSYSRDVLNFIPMYVRGTR